MHHRRSDWRGWLVCAVVSLLFLLPTVTLAAEGGGEHGGGGLINLDKSLIVQVVNFVILLIVLQKFLYKPLLAKMEERTGAIKRSLDEAQAARADAVRQQEENAAQLRAAYAEAASIRDQALREAEEAGRKQLEAAQVQARKLVEDTKAQLDGEIRRAREELRRETTDLALAVAEKLVRRTLREEDHRKIVADAIAGLKTS
ncbi:MAG TPA: F0F1 ATP synthase subunit B [Patescibacteria group bacterium]|jgi:F-type H+-transporting ATPase subunit b|nr:F0F1 ATP synthase subunit B [Patescibacteria group bacterium]